MRFKTPSVPYRAAGLGKRKRNQPRPTPAPNRMHEHRLPKLLKSSLVAAKISTALADNECARYTRMIDNRLAY